MKREDDEFDDLIWYEAGLDEDGLDYWAAFGKDERSKRHKKKERKKSAPAQKETDKEFSPIMALLLIIMAVVLILSAGNK
ncbi:MAG: hypothetical protein IJ573_10175 [Clostridia bacterium]|nr:hypothetical protein [Clostridia bacterium]